MGARGTRNHPDPGNNAPHSAFQRVPAGQRPVDPRLERLATLISTSPHNLVAAGERAHVYQRHLLECDTLADHLSPSGRWMDLGTGGGLPGLVLAHRFPAVAWTLVDATAKKVAAVQSFAEDLGLENVQAVHGRAESLAARREFRGEFNGVVTRAVAPLPTLVELCRGFVRDGGVVVAVKGPTFQAELAAASAALRTLRLELVSTERLDVSTRESWVVTMRANGAPPPGYPRRNAVPKADPIR